MKKKEREKGIQIQPHTIHKNEFRAARVAQWLSATFSPGCGPGDPGSSSTSGSLHGMEPASLSAYVCASLSLSVCISHE